MCIFLWLLNRRINHVFVGLLAFMHVLCWTMHLTEPSSAFSWTFVYFWEVIVFTDQFHAWIVEIECRCMHKSVRIKNRDDCRLDWSIPWSIGATHRFSAINEFCREWTVGIESTDKYLMVQKNPTTKVVRKLTDPQISEVSASKRRLTVNVKAENI